MNNSDVAEVLERIGVLLEIKGENPFKTRAYGSGARAVESLAEDLSVLIKEERLGDVPGIGPALRDKITELVTTGKLDYFEKLKASLPPGLPALLEIPGLGPKKIKALNDQLGVTDVTTLEAACRDHRVAALTGFGEKTEKKILEGIERNKEYAKQHRYGDVIEVAEELVDIMRTHPHVTRISIAGSLRRGKEITKDIDLLASSPQPESVLKAFASLPDVETVVGCGDTKASVILKGGFACDLRVVPDIGFAAALHHFTGSKEHNVAMRQRAIAQGLKLSEWGLFPEKPEKSDKEPKALPIFTEENLFQKLGLDYIPPELRENLGEIEAAEDGRIPHLIEWTNLRGTFHCHTTASDGKNSLKDMATAAEDLGLEYLGIADHSKSSYQANGLTEERLATQQEEIRKLNKTFEGFQVFSGCEVDILKDGRLDFDDSVLKSLDYVVASVHNVFGLPEDEMTSRIIRAMENPYVTMLGHATGRILLVRESYQLNLSKIIDCAAETGTWIELNASPQRLDMDWRWWRRARDKGVKCVINPDAHSINALGHLKVGVNIARKGWLRASDVVNTQKLSAIPVLLAAKRSL